MHARDREVERERREKDEEGAAGQALSYGAAQLLRLQATAGNQAVAKLMRVGKEAAKRLKKEPGGVTLEAMKAFQTKGGLSDKDVDALLRLEDEDLASAIRLDATKFKGCAEETDMEARLAYAKRSGDAPKTAGVKKTTPRDEAVSEVMGKGVLEPTAKSFVGKVGVGEARAFVAKYSMQAVQAAAALVTASKGAATLEEIEALLSHDAGLKKHGADVVLPLALTYGVGAVTVALSETSAEKSEGWLKAFLSIGAKADSDKPFKDLIRLKGRLADGKSKLKVFQADVEYLGSHNPPSRTGFLRDDFGGTYVELHTHWNENECRLVSIHVKDGPDKGLEINKWGEFFPEVNGAVLTAHNSASGGLKATTTGAKPLTL